MNEETKYANQLQLEAGSENVNRLPYEPPMLRKHGKVNNATQTIMFTPDFDGFINFSDIDDSSFS